MLEYILNILKANDTLVNILKPTIKEPKIYQMSTVYLSTCIIYTWELTDSDKVVNQYRMKVKIVAPNQEVTDSILSAINDELLSFGDFNKHDRILSCNMNGGGILEDDERGMIHTIKYYYIKSNYEGKM